MRTLRPASPTLNDLSAASARKSSVHVKSNFEPFSGGLRGYSYYAFRTLLQFDVNHLRLRRLEYAGVTAHPLPPPPPPMPHTLSLLLSTTVSLLQGSEHAAQLSLLPSTHVWPGNPETEIM